MPAQPVREEWGPESARRWPTGCQYPTGEAPPTSLCAASVTVPSESVPFGSQVFRTWAPERGGWLTGSQCPDLEPLPLPDNPRFGQPRRRFRLGECHSLRTIEAPASVVQGPPAAAAGGPTMRPPPRHRARPFRSRPRPVSPPLGLRTGQRKSGWHDSHPGTHPSRISLVSRQSMRLRETASRVSPFCTPSRLYNIEP